MSNQNNVKFIPFPDEDQNEFQDDTPVISEEVLNEDQDEQEILIDNLNSKPFMKLHYSMALLFDPATTLFLSYLIQVLEPYNRKKKQIDDDGFFMCRRSYIKGRIGLTHKTQERVTYKLADKNLIQYERRSGMPPSGWIKLNHSIINEFLINAEKKGKQVQGIPN